MKGLPEYVDGQIGDFELGEHGRIQVSGGCARLRVLVHSTSMRVFDVWVEIEDEWCQLSRLDDEFWGNEDLSEEPQRVRLWLGRSVTPALVKVGQPTHPIELQAYVPVVDGAPPLPAERSVVGVPTRLAHWVHLRSQDILVSSMLEEWNIACAQATASGWMPNTPAGTDLLPLFARTAPRAVLDADQAFARWLVFEVGQASKRGVTDRLTLEARRVGVRLLHDALTRLVRAIAPQLQVSAAPPPQIGPLERHRWLVAEGLAGRVDNPFMGHGPHRPIFVLRVLLTAGDEVLVEGEVV